MNVLDYIIESKKQGKKLLAILIDPDKVSDTNTLINDLSSCPPHLIFVGGSVVDKDVFDAVITAIKSANICPVVIFPGGHEQINDHSDAILLLCLISGRNPEYLIGQHVKAAKSLDKYSGDVIPTSYLLIDGDNTTSVQEVSETTPLSQENVNLIVDTVIAGRLLGHQIHYLEAGSGAQNPVSIEAIQAVRKNTNLPLIVGGGIRNTETAHQILEAGADLIVVGNGFEDRKEFLKELKEILD